jgi:CheY-like chemotaxis protein
MTKVFLAEDDQTMVTLLETLLRLEGIETVSIDLSDGQLFSKLASNVPELLLLDVNLPGESGLDVMRAMRADKRFADTRVIMASGMSVKDQCLASGANDFLLKPYMPDDLIGLIKKHSR